MTGLHPTCRIALAATLVLSLGGCSIRKTAVNKIGDALANPGSNFAADDDPELVGQAIPFGLKTMEGLLEESPKHAGLLLATTSGFVQYAYGWVQLEADIVEAKDLARATELRGRAQKLYLRAREYGLRGLELDEGWDLGSIHEFFISWEAARSSIGGSLERAREHFDRALALSQGRRAFPYLSFAESVSVVRQDRAQFREMLDKALAVDVSHKDAQRLANLLAQKRARFQLGRVDDLFVE